MFRRNNLHILYGFRRVQAGRLHHNQHNQHNKLRTALNGTRSLSFANLLTWADCARAFESLPENKNSNDSNPTQRSGGSSERFGLDAESL